MEVGVLSQSISREKHLNLWNPMKTKFKSIVSSACHSFGGAVCTGAVLLMAARAESQNLFVATTSDNIYEFTPSGVQSTFASGLANACGLAFNSAGDLFVATGNDGIDEFTPGGGRSKFAYVISVGLTFNSAGDLFDSDWASGNIYEFTPSGVQSTFASGLYEPIELAFQGVTLPVPEPSVLGLLAVGATALLVRCRRKQASSRPSKSVKQSDFIRKRFFT